LIQQSLNSLGHLVNVKGFGEEIISAQAQRFPGAVYNSPFAIIAKASGLGAVTSGGLYGTVPELLFEKRELIPEVQQLLTSI
jgi:hypothetical protein